MKKDRQHVSRDEGGRRLTSIENNVNASILWLKDYKRRTKKITYGNQKRRWQHNDQQNNIKTEKGKKSVWIVQARLSDKGQKNPVVHFAVKVYHKVKVKESGKRDKYLDLARELEKLWNMIVVVIRIIICALNTVSKGLE